MLFAVMGSIIGALAVFALALQLGVWLVKRLALPQDLPEEILFDAPPPPMLARPDNEQARQAAERQRARLAPFAEARRICRQAEEIQLAWQAWQSAPGDTAVAHRQRCRQALDAIEPAVDAIHQALSSRQPASVTAACQEHAATITAARDDCDAALRERPPIDNRRLWLMLGLLAVAVLFQVVVALLLGGGDG